MHPEQYALMAVFPITLVLLVMGEDMTAVGQIGKASFGLLAQC